MILLVHAHPHPRQSVANRALLDAVRGLPGLTAHSLYDAYPDFDIDPAAERARLDAARLVIWQHPIYWYGAPALLKLWFEEVLSYGYAYGEGGTALHGKDCLWVATTGGPPDWYTPDGPHGHEFSAFAPAVKQTARFCGMNWLPPLVVHAAHQIGADGLAAQAAAYRKRLQDWIDTHG
jgi:glutathione-regulated potassium-efflux system ancillary protein KefF